MESVPQQLCDVFPAWGELSADQRDDLARHAAPRRFAKGEVLRAYEDGCQGLILVKSGRLRAFILSDMGKEVTLYRLLGWDVCLFSAACVLRNIQFDIHIEAEEDTEGWMVPPALYQRLMDQSLPVARYTNELMSARFSEVMWTLEQILFKSMDARLAGFLCARAALDDTGRLALTHEEIANNLGTAREVVTRMLRYFQSEGLVRLARGAVELCDTPRLAALAGQPAG